MDRRLVRRQQTLPQPGIEPPPTSQQAATAAPAPTSVSTRRMLTRGVQNVTETRSRGTRALQPVMFPQQTASRAAGTSARCQLWTGTGLARKWSWDEISVEISHFCFMHTSCCYCVKNSAVPNLCTYEDVLPYITVCHCIKWR